MKLFYKYFIISTFYAKTGCLIGAKTTKTGFSTLLNVDLFGPLTAKRRPTVE